MSNPTLLVIAGCNGSGKSSFSKLLAGPDFFPFDYDTYFLKFYRSLFDSDIREEMAHNMAFMELEKQIDEAVDQRKNFSYETNFNSTPLHWPSHFKQRGYKLHLIYFCLDSIEEAIRRVAIRVHNGGHFVPKSEIRKRYFEGFANLNANYSYFDVVDLFDTSGYLHEPKYIMSIEKNILASNKNVPDYLKILIPSIYNTK